jgi:hypothetical protein
MKAASVVLDAEGWKYRIPRLEKARQLLAEDPGTPESVRRAAREALRRLEG